MRAGVAVAVGWIASAGIAEASPRVDASGFVGVSALTSHTALGNSWAPEQVPGTSSLFGVRGGYLVAPALPEHFELAVEGELALAPAFTGTDAQAGRMSYFAPVLAWRGHALLRWARWREVQPHLVVGGGGASVLSSSPFMSKETDPVAYWGLGARVPIGRRWSLRVDVRHGVMPARDGGATSTLEAQLGFGATFGGRPASKPLPVVVEDRDRDGDGIVDRLDSCPTEPENFNGVADDDGCPEADPDGDGIVGDADRCPDEPEDVDGFEDGDGCPDRDNDKDGIEDRLDGCPGEPETVNGFEDGDGCPDHLPAEVSAALATVVKFAPNRARVTAAAGLRPVLVMLQQRGELKLVIRGHGAALAKRRAEAAKWWLIDQGIAEDRIATALDDGGAQTITFELAPGAP